MAVKRPLCNYNGKLKELLTTDTLPGGGGSGITRVISNITVTTTGATAAITDYVYLCTGTFTYTQPTAVGNTNLYTIKNVGTGTITIAFTSGQTGDSNATIQLTQNQSIDLISNNTNYSIV